MKKKVNLFFNLKNTFLTGFIWYFKILFRGSNKDRKHMQQRKQTCLIIKKLFKETSNCAKCISECFWEMRTYGNEKTPEKIGCWKRGN